MASVPDICNMALSALGKAAEVISISPPDGSVSADLCARFYGQARDRALEMEDWAFARVRAALAPLAANPSTVWPYAYAKPADCVMPRRVLTLDTYRREDDSAQFECEGDAILSDQANAILVYTKAITDTTRFSPSFVDVVSYLLAAYVAGPLITGSDGATVAADLRSAAAAAARDATTNNALRQEVQQQFIPGATAARVGRAHWQHHHGRC